MAKEEAWDEVYDLIILGTGAAGLTAAITARINGLNPLVIERSERWGGTTALSGGLLWVPANRLMARDGVKDSVEDARIYLRSLLEKDNPAASEARVEAFLKSAPELVDFLAAQGFAWVRNEHYPDYESHRPRASRGRGLEGAIFDGKQLGEWLRTMRRAGDDLPAMTTSNGPLLMHARRSFKAMSRALRVGLEDKFAKLVGKTPMGMGQALIGRLMEIALKLDIPIYLGATVTRLLKAEDRIIGLAVIRGEQDMRIGAAKGIMLCCGGFAKNAALRAQHQPTDGRWSNASPEDLGDAISLTSPLGAATAQWIVRGGCLTSGLVRA